MSSIGCVMGIIVDLITLLILAYVAGLVAKTKMNVCPHGSGSPISAKPPDARVLPPIKRQDTLEHQSVVRPPVAPKPESDYEIVVIHEPRATPISDETNGRRPDPSIGQSGEFVIDSDGDLFGLLSKCEADFSDISEEDLILAADIGLSERGFSMASRLIEAGFDISTTSQKWGQRTKRVELPPDHILEE